MERPVCPIEGAAVLSFLSLLSLLAGPTAAQAASIEWRVAFNGALGGPNVVTDNGPDDLDGRPGMLMVVLGPMTNGVMTLDAGTTLIGQKIPPPILNGRELIVTSVSGHVGAGQFQNPAGTIDIYACYKFAGPGLQVGPPHFFRRAIDGSFVNNVDGSIDFAEVRYNAAANTACGIGPGDPGAFVQSVGPLATPPIPFLHTAGPFPSAVAAVDIGAIVRLVLHNNGDGIDLPNSARASVTEDVPAPVPALPVWAVGLLVMGVLGAGVLILRRSRP